ncbi:metallophosphoesterase family protein [Afipia sp. TerB]
MAETPFKRDGFSIRHLIDPRAGDIEDDVSSPKRRSLLAIAGTLLAEISLPKLLFAWTILIGVPSVLLGLAPLVASAWLTSVSSHILVLTEAGAAVILVLVLAIGWLTWRSLLRTAEESFWSLNALLVQPCYMLGTETLRHVNERLLNRAGTKFTPIKLRAASSAIAGIVMFVFGVLIVGAVWPISRWTGTMGDLLSPHHLLVPTIANAVILVSAYFAVVSLLHGFSDARTEQPFDLETFDTELPGRPMWRVAHLTDLHVVGERYGFRIESGRMGPCGNDRLQLLLEKLARIHSARPLDLVLITGDITDAGRSTEWAEFFAAIERFPDLAERMVIAPGNHDLNISSRSNPAQIDLPFSSRKLSRQARALSAMNAIQGDHAYVAENSGAPWPSLREATSLHQKDWIRLADEGGLSTTIRLRHAFRDTFPMIVPPDEMKGLGLAVLDSNAESHFSFTNALGLISMEQANRLFAALERYPEAGWIIAIHHHLQEYPKAVPFSIRIGTSLINGSWFIRKLRPFASRIVVMHGHRHLDWIGTFGPLKVISGPSPVMNAIDGAPTHFYIHSLTTEPDGRIGLLQPEQVMLADSTAV